MMSAFLIIDDDEFLLLLIRAVNEARTRDPQLGKLVLGTYSLRMNCSTN